MITLVNVSRETKPHLKNELPVKVYVLIDPRSKHIRYVGVTRQGLGLRLAQHVYEAQNHRGGRLKRAWVNRLLDAGLRPVIAEVDHCWASQQDDYERAWIKFYRDRGYKLVNESAGGAGASHTQRSEDRAKRSEGMKRYRAGRTLSA